MTSDLSILAHGQIYAALAKYQDAVAHGEAIPRPSAFGLAITHYQSPEGIGCRLVHESGALLDSGPVVAPTVLEAAQRAAALVLGTVGSILVPVSYVSKQTEELPPAPIASPQTVEPPAQTVEPPTQTVEPEPEIDVEAILSRMDELHTQSPDALKALITKYKAHFEIGRTPFPKSITTPERAQFLLDALGA